MSIEAKASIAYIMCSVIQRGVVVVTLPVFTRLMTTAQYGQTSVYLSWLAIFTIFISLNLPYGSFQTAMIRFEDRREAYVASLDGIFVFLACLFLLVYLPFRSFWDSLLGMPTLIVLTMVVEVVATSFIQCWFGLNRFQFKYKSVFFVTAAWAILSQVASLLSVVFFEDKGNAKIIGSALVTFCFGIAIASLCVRRGGRMYDKQMWKYALSFNIPLIAYYMSQVVFNQSDILMINFFCGSEKSAIYNVAYSLAMLLTFVITAINGSYTPWFYGKLNEGKETEDRFISATLSAGLAMLLFVVVIAAPEVVLIMAGEAYMEAIWVIPPVAASVLLLFYACLFDRVLFFYEKKTYLTVGTIVSAIVNIVLNLVFIPLVGFVAAGYTTFLSYLTLVLFDLYYVKKISKKNSFDMGAYNLKMLILVLALFIAASLLAMVFYGSFLLRYALFLVGLAILACNRKRILIAISSIGV